MDHKTEKYWGTLLLRMAAEARQEGDLVTAELLGAEVMRSFAGANCLAPRWRKFDARLDDQLRGTPVVRH
jgi:hypothetical protein